MSAGDRDPVVAVEADVLDNERVGAYQRLTLAVPGVAATARPGHFAALTVGGETSGLLLRRSFSIHRVAAGSDPAGDRLEIVVADAGPGTHWLTQRTPGDRVGVLAPLGNGFSLPAAPGDCVLIGGGYGSAPLPWLAEHLRAMGSRVHMILGAATRDRLFGAAEAAAVADSVHVVTVDGSAGAVGLVTDPLRQLLRDNNIGAVYACGPMGMLRVVGELAIEAGAVAQVAVEEAMACGVGVCMTCVLPIRGHDGDTRMTRTCLDGPVFDAHTVRWEAAADGRVAVPADAVGASSAPVGWSAR